MLAEAAAELLDAGELERPPRPRCFSETAHGRSRAAARKRRRTSASAASPPGGAAALAVESARADEPGELHLAVDEAGQAMDAAGEALRMADELGLDGLRAHALSTRGFSRVMTGDLEGLRDLRESVEVAAGANSPQAARGFNNLASITADLGDLPRAFELYAESRRFAERFGDAIALGWLDVERAYELYWCGDWDGALALGDGLLAGEEDAGASLHEVDARLVRAKIAAGREGAEASLADLERALELARAVGAPQTLLPVLAFDAHARRRGPRRGAGGAADELVRLWLDEGRGLSLASFWLADLAFALAALDRGGELGAAAGRTPTRTRWLEAAESAGEGDWPRTAGDLRPYRLPAGRGPGADELPRPRRRRPGRRGRGRARASGRVLPRGRSPGPALAPAKYSPLLGRAHPSRRQCSATRPPRTPRARRACRGRRRPCRPRPRGRCLRCSRGRTRCCSSSGRRRSPRLRARAPPCARPSPAPSGPGCPGSIFHQ